MTDQPKIKVQVAYALPNRHRIIDLEVDQSCTVIEAVQQSNIAEQFPEIDLDKAKFGIFAKVVKKDQALEDGQRIEIYRPLIADPKEARKKRAAKAKDDASEE